MSDLLNRARAMAEEVRYDQESYDLLIELIAEVELLRAQVATRDRLARENARLRRLVPQGDKQPG